jgi:hypothetical protein
MGDRRVMIKSLAKEDLSEAHRLRIASAELDGFVPNARSSGRHCDSVTDLDCTFDNTLEISSAIPTPPEAAILQGPLGSSSSQRQNQTRRDEC